MKSFSKEFMNFRIQSIIDLVKLRLRIIRKSWIVRKETRLRGQGTRSVNRLQRQEFIRSQKLAIRDSLVTSWGLGEIHPPTEEERMRFWLYYPHLPMSYILEVKKKYWNL
jgi:hypothetical protein